MKNKVKYVATGFICLTAITMRLIALEKSNNMTVKPETVVEDTVSSELTEVEQNYVDKFLAKARRERKLTPTSYKAERYTNSEVKVSVTFKETKQKAVVRYDPWLDRWSGSLTLKGE